jgi:trehalose 2-sulfotransferase
VCATPRSGSTLLCETLTATGVAGRPAEFFESLRSTGLPRQPRQYFCGLDDPALEHLGETLPGSPEAPGEFERVLPDALRAGTTRNGVFGAKLMWGYLPDFAARIKAFPGCERRSTVRAIAAVFPGVRYVQVLRHGKVAQAVSLWKAVQTRQWRHDGVEERDVELVYSRSAVAHLVTQLVEQERAWTNWLRNTGEPPVRVVYEDYARAPSQGVSDVLGRLGIASDGARPVPDSIMRSQSDELSREWIARFEHDASKAVA